MERKIFIPGLLSAIICVLFHSLIYPVIFKAGLSNVVYLFVLSFIFFFSFLVFFHIFRLRKTDNKVLKTIIGPGCLLIFVTWFVWMYFSEEYIPFFRSEQIFRHKISPFIYFAALIVITCVILLLFKFITAENNSFRLIPAFCLSLFQTVFFSRVRSSSFTEARRIYRASSGLISPLPSTSAAVNAAEPSS